MKGHLRPEIKNANSNKRDEGAPSYMNRRKREQLILDAAIQVFARQGYSKTSVSEIIHEADVARGTFYLYFKSKKDIFNGLLDRFLMELTRNVAKINSVRLPAEGDLNEHFRMLSADLVETVTRNRQLTQIILFQASGLDPSFDSKLGLFYDQLTRIIRHNLDAQVASALFRPLPTELVARCMIGSVKEIISWWIQNDQFEMESAIRGVIDYLLGGLMPMALFEAPAVVSQEPKPVSRHDVNLH